MRPASVAAVLGSGLIGAILIVSAVAIAWLAFATPVLRGFDTPGRATAGQTASGVVAWVVALVLPAACMVVGLVRLDWTTKALAGLRPRRGILARLRADLGDDYLVATDVALPDGRYVPELVVGPHGIAVLELAPPAAITRRHEGRWEARLDTGAWMPMENPLDKASRDADRVRRWLAADERDFVVKVHAALVTPDAALPRTPTCAVITREQAPAWIASLPTQRSLTADRLDAIVARISGR